MSIKSKLKLILFITCSFSMLMAGFMLWNLVKISQNTQAVNDALHHVEMVNSIHTGLKDQMREAMDYFISGDREGRVALDAYSSKTVAVLGEWIAAEEEGVTHLEVSKQRFDRSLLIRDSYNEAATMISDSVALMYAGKKEKAFKLLGEDVERYVDAVLLPEIDRAVNDEVERVKGAFDELSMSMGSMPWIGKREITELRNAEAAFGYFLLVNGINTNLIREIQEATFFVVSGGEEERRQYIEYGANVTRAIDELIYQLSVHTLDGVEGEDEDLRLAKTVKYTQYELLAMFQKAQQLREAGEIKAGHTVLTEEVIPLGNIIFPAITELMEDSREEVEEMCSELSRLMFNAATKGVLLLLVVTSFIILISVCVTRGIITSLNKLSDGAKSIGDGSLTHRIELKSKDEFRDLAIHFNEMVESLKETTVSRDLLSTEIEERKRSEEKISYLAYYDQLTGLPNRALLLDRINQALVMAQRQGTIFAVLFFDLDRFKIINDTLGHTMGDEVLKDVANRLKGHARRSDTLARQGGDEFTVVALNIISAANVSKVAENIFLAFKEPFNISGQKFSISVSMGISIYPNDGVDADTLIKNADIALYKSKDEGRNSYCFYNSSMDEGIAKRLTLGNKLCQAIEKGELLLHYQPQVDTATGEIFGLEALVRWQEPEGSIISPAEFIPVAEDTGLIVPLGEWVLREACRQNREWQDKGFKHTTVSVNISMLQFKQKEFVSKIERVLEETGLDPKYLELELTESIVMKDVESTLKILHELKAMGLRLSIDDFGTGYSSLEYLKRMPIDMLKIDQSFMKDITVNPDDVVIAKAIIQMAHNLQMEIIAEGVETREQLEQLKNLECSKVQGYLFSRPLPHNEITELLNKGWCFVVECVDAVEHKGPRKSA